MNAPGLDAAMVERLREQVSPLAQAAGERMGQRPWYRELSAEHRASVRLVAEAGIRSFVSWVADEAHPSRASVVFAEAPRELTSALSLEQIIELIRLTIEAVESSVPRLTTDQAQADQLTRAVLQFSRDIAFAAATVHARAAEVRGAWDVRLEALVVDAVLRGEATEEIHSRAAALGWGRVNGVVVAVGTCARDAPEAELLSGVRRAARRSGFDALVTMNSGRVVAVLAGVQESEDVFEALGTALDGSTVVVGPVVPHFFAAGRSARAALSGWTAARTWTDAPRAVGADQVLPERVLTGDEVARRELVHQAIEPLSTVGRDLLTTAQSFVSHGGVLEATARELYVHVNTVRYRLHRVLELTGLDLTMPRDSWTMQVALVVWRADTPPRSDWRRSVSEAEPASS